MSNEESAENAVEVRPVVPKNWTLLVATAVVTPIVDPGGHPNDPGTVWCPPLNTIALSGVGKSQRIKKIGRSMGLPGVYVVFAATKQPSSFEGAAVPTPDGIIIECILPAARQAIDNGGGLIFFDEANGASPRTQAALLSTLNDRQFGDHVIPPATRMLLAMNPPEHSAGGFALTAPMANRMGHVWYPTPDKDDWAKWLNGTEEEVPSMKDWEEKVREGWSDNWTIVNALAQGFIKRNAKDTFVNQPDYDDPNASQAWPSYRVWHWALCAATTCRCLGHPEWMEIDLIHAYCGEAAAIKWSAWVQEADLPDPEEMIRNGYTPDNIRIDRTYAALTNLLGWAANLQKKDPRQGLHVVAKTWKIVDTVLEAHMGDLAVLCAQKLHRQGLGRVLGSPVDDAAGTVIYKLQQKGYTELV